MLTGNLVSISVGGLIALFSSLIVRISSLNVVPFSFLVSVA